MKTRHHRSTHAAHHAARRGTARRGNADIELILVMWVFLLLMALGFRQLVIGRTQLEDTYAAENQAWGQTNSGINVTNSNELTPVDGPAAIRPGLPNRFDESAPVVVADVSNIHIPPLLPKLNIQEKAVFLDPTWHYAASPNRDDQDTLRSWFESYVSESHPDSLNQALGLQPAWRP